MVSTTPVPPGRPRAFDIDEALDRAVLVFWSKGFEGASLDDLTVTGFGFTIGGLLLMPLAWLAEGGITFRPGLAAIGLLVALGTGPTAVAYTLYFRGLRTAAASTAARLALLEPLTGAILAATLLGERLSATGIAGAAIIGAAVILTVQAEEAARWRGPLRRSTPRAHRCGD